MLSKMFTVTITVISILVGVHAHSNGNACSCEGSTNIGRPAVLNISPPGSPSFRPSFASSITPPSSSATSECTANSNWPGFASLKHLFVLWVTTVFIWKFKADYFSGDSYTTTGFNETGIQPTPTNPLGNPNYPGWTSANGPNWVDYLTVKYNESLLLTYNLAFGGATIDSTLVAPYLPTVSSVSEQVEKLWFPAYAGKSAKWASNDTLFAFFDGINDVGNTWWNGPEGNSQLYAKIFTVWRGLLDDLYYQGARNFAFLNVPPVDRSPLVLANTPDQQAVEKAAILYWNDLIIQLATEFRDTFPDANIFTSDAWKVFTEVLDDPKSYNATSGLRNTTAYCVAYQKYFTPFQRDWKAC